VKSGEEVTVEDVKDWLVEVKEIDKLLRDRLYVLTVAAELGWRVASDMASNKKGNTTLSWLLNLVNCVCSVGNNADKDLAKAVKKEEKRKREEREKPKKRKYNFNQAFRQYHQPPQMAPAYNPALAAAVALPPPLPPPPMYQRRVESRTCLGCGQVGHLLRNCPRGGPSTSAGMAQK